MSDQQLGLEYQVDATSQTDSLETMPKADGRGHQKVQPVLCYVSLDDLAADDNLVSALSDQVNANNLYNSRYVYVQDGAAKYFGQILKGPIYTPEWGAVRDGTNTYPIVSGDKVEYVPSYHGFVQIQILGQIEIFAGSEVLQKTFHRPHPKSKIMYVPEDRLIRLLKLPDTQSLMGVLANYSNKDAKEAVRFSIEDKLIRKQLGIFGATGQGKSNTVLSLAESLVGNGWCVIIFDHSGEYTECNKPSEEPLFTPFWKELGVNPEGVGANFMRLVPVTDRNYPKDAVRFSVRSSGIKFSVLKSLLRLSPAQDEKLEMIAREIGDKYDGLPSLKAAVEDKMGDKDVSKGPLLRKITNLISMGGGKKDANPSPYWLFDNSKSEKADAVEHPDIFSSEQPTETKSSVVYLSKHQLIKPSTMIVVDFGNTTNQNIINVVALDILSKLEQAKASVQRANRTKVAVFMEEAHTYFSADYTGNDQIASSLTNIVKRIFKIGRKFFLNPVVISQQPGDVPSAILSQCNTKIIHQLSDDEDIRKVTKGAAKLYQSVIPDLRTGEALVTNSEFTTAQIIRIRPAKSKKIDPYLAELKTEEVGVSDDAEGVDYITDED